MKESNIKTAKLAMEADGNIIGAKLFQASAPAQGSDAQAAVAQPVRASSSAGASAQAGASRLAAPGPQGVPSDAPLRCHDGPPVAAQAYLPVAGPSINPAFRALPRASGVYAVALRDSLGIPAVKAFFDHVAAVGRR
jgi:hypothetical protein